MPSCCSRISCWGKNRSKDTSLGGMPRIGLMAENAQSDKCGERDDFPKECLPKRNVNDLKSQIPRGESAITTVEANPLTSGLPSQAATSVRPWSISSLPSPASKVRSALFAFSKVVYTANKDKQYRVFKEEVRSLASEVAAKHLAKSSSADQSAVNRVPVLTNPSCSNSSLSLCFDYGDTMPITGYDVSKSGCCPSSEEGFAAKTGYAESELRDARARSQTRLRSRRWMTITYSFPYDRVSSCS
uniref:Uncharacterized protein n=1 Tax=Fagus sylvatica TaxID=28930 RepID=A0A2N9GHE8_FAGSY